jgi:hypothetical protein
MNKILPLLILLFCSRAFSQAAIKTDIEKTPNQKNIEDFILPGWSILTSVKGDLNKDGLPDVVLVLQSNREQNLEDDKKPSAVSRKILIVLFKNTDSSYRFIGKTSDSYMQINNTTTNRFDPFQSASIQKGVLELNFKRIDSLKIVDCAYKFRWDKSLFPLIGAELNYQNPDSTYIHYSYNFLTLLREIRKGKIGDTWAQIGGAFYPDFPAKNLFSILSPFTWEVEDGVYL